LAINLFRCKELEKVATRTIDLTKKPGFSLVLYDGKKIIF